MEGIAQVKDITQIDIRKSEFWGVFSSGIDRCKNLDQYEKLRGWLNAPRQKESIATYTGGKQIIIEEMKRLKVRLQVESLEPMTTAETILRGLLIKTGNTYDSIEACSIECFGTQESGKPKYESDSLTPTQIDSIARSLLSQWAFKFYKKDVTWCEKTIRSMEKGIDDWTVIADRFTDPFDRPDKS